VAGFRLKMATLHGEKIAEEFGFTQFPIDPKEIARRKEIEVVAKPADLKGVSGAIIFAGDAVTIIYSNEFQNTGFENFSIAHELGHYFLPGHPEEIGTQGGSHVSRADFTQSTSIELEADHFASGLLMPTTLVRRFLSRNQIGLEGILKLADKAGCSCTSAAIRAAEVGAYPIAVIVSQGEHIAYSFTSNSFKELGKLAFLKKGTPLPDSETLRFNRDPSNVQLARRITAETTLQVWFDCPNALALDEEVIGLGKYGYALTVLTSEALPEDPSEHEDEDTQLEEQWTPRFAYRR